MSFLHRVVRTFLSSPDNNHHRPPSCVAYSHLTATQCANLHFKYKMRYLSRFYLLFAFRVSLTQAQGSDDDCTTCYLGDLFKDNLEHGLDDLILPAAPDLPSNPGATDPTQGYVEPQTDAGEQRSTNNLPGSTSQPDLELQVIGEPDPKCDPNGAVVSSLLPIH